MKKQKKTEKNEAGKRSQTERKDGLAQNPRKWVRGV